MPTGDPQAPEDPALARLLPDAYGDDDPTPSREFRRYTDADLRARKRADAEVGRADAARGRRQAAARPRRGRRWLGLLNDLRLVLGTRLEVTEDLDEDALGADDAAAARAAAVRAGSAGCRSRCSPAWSPADRLAARAEPAPCHGRPGHRPRPPGPPRRGLRRDPGQGRGRRRASSRWRTPSARRRSTASTRRSSCGCGARWTTPTRCRSSSTTRTRPPRRTRRAPTSAWRRSRTPTTCSCRPAATRTRSARSASSTASSPRSRCRSRQGSPECAAPARLLDLPSTTP